ncbi:MAG: FtsQ-type POTRA domain-containing protein [Candidatus Aminicenantes bacterium]|nr:FtsQ-type POTRA domain-containing protein [Candidatus Aminicenantes bacterium]
MAYLNPPLRYRPPAALSRAERFQRGLEKAPVKKVQRKLTLKLRHIFFFFLLLSGLFFLLTKFAIFLITWEELDVKKTQVLCRLDFVVRDLEPVLDAARLGNLLVLDISRLQERIEAHRWVKQARLRKVFPSTLKVEIRERSPAAVLETGAAFLLIDREGVLLEQLRSREESQLPLLTDASGFKKHYRQKLDLAWACLDSLSPEIRQRVDSLDLSRADGITLHFKDRPTRLLLGTDRFLEKTKFFWSALDKLESDNGPLEYVDLRFDDRIYIKPLPVLGQTARLNPEQEVK